MRPDRRNTLKRRSNERGGYALVVVLMFHVMFFMLLGVAFRRTSSVIRLAVAQSQQTKQDQGSLRVLADAMQLLETGLPPTSPYECGAVIEDAVTGEDRYFRIVFVRDDSLPPEERLFWTVSVTQTNLQPVEMLPEYFETANP
jgi:hypothetical protein